MATRIEFCGMHMLCHLSPMMILNILPPQGVDAAPQARYITFSARVVEW